MKILLITNNENLFEQYSYLHITNSLIQAVGEFSQYDFIIVDQDNIRIEGEDKSFELIKDIKEKVLFLGNKVYKGFTSISLEEFSVSNIELYLKGFTDSDDNVEDTEDIQTINELLDKYIDPGTPIKDISTQLVDYDYDFRKRFYDVIYNIDKKRINKLPLTDKIRWEYYYSRVTSKF